jgi:hypothetical protein
VRFGGIRWLAAGALALAVGLPGTVKADNDVGCGVGTQIMEGEQGLIPHLFASFTNGVTFQSLSLTFGWMGCDARDTVTADAQLRKFASGNIDRLSRDMARGGGESLEALAELMGVAPADRPALGTLVQSHFGELFPSERATSDDVLETLDRLLRQDEALSRYARS